MQERHHVKTTPGEAHAVPEYTPHPVRREEGGNVQMDDINIPLVATIVAFFAVLLAVTIVSLQAWFYHQQAAQRAAVILPQDDPRTEFGALLQKQNKELYDPPGFARHMGATTTGPAAGASQPGAGDVRQRIPIDAAMNIVQQEYAQQSSGGGGE